MTAEMLITLFTLNIAALLLITNLVRSDVVGMLVLLILHLTGVVTLSEALSGFSNPAVIIIAAMFLVSEAIIYTGIGQRIGTIITQKSGANEKKLVVLLMVASGSLGAFMSSAATVAIFIPITMAMAAKAELNHRRLLMPLAVSSLISGMMTLVATTPNIVINDILRDNNLETLSFFSFTPYGLTVLFLATLFMAFFGQDLLTRKKNVPARQEERTISELMHFYGIDERWRILRVPMQSTLIGQAVSQLRLREELHVKVVALRRPTGGPSEFLAVDANTIFQANDLLVLIGSNEWVEQFSEMYNLIEQPVLKDETARKQFFEVIGAAEVMLTPESNLVGKSVREIRFQSLYHCMVIGIRRQGTTTTTKITDMPLKFGDVLLVVGAWHNILKLREQRSDYLLLTLPDDYREIVPAKGRAPVALFILTGMVLSMALGLTSNVMSVLCAAVALVLTGCVKMGNIYKAIEWKTVMLIAGIMPLALAMQKSGLVDATSKLMFGYFTGQPPLLVLATLFIVTAGLGLFMSNTPVAILVTPMALQLSFSLGISPQACAMTVALACSSAFLSPFGSPVNMIVREPGGYSFLDYLKVGLPLLAISLVVTLVLTYFIYLR